MHLNTVTAKQFLKIKLNIKIQAGKQLQFELGRYFRRRYEKLLGPNISPNRVFIRSTGVDRVVKSAQYNAAGLLLPSGEQSWNEFEKTQLIPNRTVPMNEDYLLYPVPCKKADEIRMEYLKSDEIRSVLEKYSGLRKYLEKHSGTSVQTVLDMYTFYDALNIEKLRGLP